MAAERLSANVKPDQVRTTSASTAWPRRADGVAGGDAGDGEQEARPARPPAARARGWRGASRPAGRRVRPGSPAWRCGSKRPSRLRCLRFVGLLRRPSAGATRRPCATSSALCAARMARCSRSMPRSFIENSSSVSRRASSRSIARCACTPPRAATGRPSALSYHSIAFFCRSRARVRQSLTRSPVRCSSQPFSSASARLRVASPIRK